MKTWNSSKTGIESYKYRKQRCLNFNFSYYFTHLMIIIIYSHSTHLQFKSVPLYIIVSIQNKTGDLDFYVIHRMRKRNSLKIRLKYTPKCHALNPLNRYLWKLQLGYNYSYSYCSSKDTVLQMKHLHSQSQSSVS